MAMRPGRIAIRPYKLFIYTVNQQCSLSIIDPILEFRGINQQILV